MPSGGAYLASLGRERIARRWTVNSLAFKGAAMIDALLEYFDGRRSWPQENFSAGNQRCLVSAMAHIRHIKPLTGK